MKNNYLLLVNEFHIQQQWLLNKRGHGVNFLSNRADMINLKQYFICNYL